MRYIPYWALKSLWSLTKVSASDEEAAEVWAGSADAEVELASSEAEPEAEVDSEAEAEADSTVAVGSREADASVDAGAKTPVLMEVEADSMADEMVILADSLIDADTAAEAEAEGRAHALFL